MLILIVKCVLLTKTLLLIKEMLTGALRAMVKKITLLKKQKLVREI
jgi:hypothetical protein